MLRTRGTAEHARHPEAEESRRRRELIREQVVKPLEQRGAENQFASIIRRSLRQGHRA